MFQSLEFFHLLLSKGWTDRLVVSADSLFLKQVFCSAGLV
jgi:hypothetical protein